MIPGKVILASESSGSIFENSKVISNVLIQEGTDYFEVGKISLFMMITFFSVITILFIFVYMKYVKKSKNEKLLTDLNEELKRDYVAIETTYNEVSQIHKELKEQYDILKANDEKNTKLAYTNYLTELPNRNAFVKKLEQIIVTLRKEETVAIMYIDLDNFKSVNDSIGHSLGDELLIDISYRLKQVIDEDDYLAHYEGDEFMIITQNIKDISEYEDKIKKLQKIFSYPFLISQKEFFITISIGVTFAPKDGKTLQSLIKNLDLAMYIAKKRGKNTYCYFDKAISERVMEKIEFQSELKKAVEEEQFLVYYQPQLDLLSSKIIGFEALLRWNHPEKGIIEPGTFLPIAEESGLIVSIGEYVFRESFSQLKRWMDEGYPNLMMAVNLSVRQFKDVNFVTMIEQLIQETGVEPSHLIFEITEEIAKHDIEYTITIMEQLKELGITFTMDDFGKGYSSISYLKELKVQNIKIDKNYIDMMMDTEQDKKLVQAIINLAHILDLKVVAKGVESMEQAKFLTEAGCDKVQGFLYSKALSKNDAIKFLSLWDGLVS
jgi:polar amino acid transport system substrate-binding protein